MHEVAGKVLGLYTQVARQLGADVSALFEGLPWDPADPPDRLDWEPFCELNARFEKLVGGPRELEEVGTRVLEMPGFLRDRNILQLVASPKQIYWSNIKWGGPSLFNHLGNEYESLGPDTCRIRITCPPEYTGCPQVFRINTGFFVAMPRILGLPDAIVESEISDREATYRISLPPSLTLWARIRRSMSTLFAARAAIEEMAEQQARLKRRFAELESARDAAVQARDEAVAAKQVAENVLKTKSALLATMSHEIRTPLNGIIGVSDLLQDCVLSDETRPLVEALQESGHTLKVLVDDILDFSKMEAQGMELEAVDFSLRASVEQVVRLFKPKCAQKGLQLEATIAPELDCIAQGDPLRLQQVLSNLVGNAVKFTDSGRIEIEVLAASSTLGRDKLPVRFEVRDTGIGLDTLTCSRIFESYTQADGSFSRKYGGTGLGLSICRALCELMGGQIGVDSTLGEGSQFWFTVLLEVRASGAGSSDFEGRRVVVIDALSSNRNAMRQQLESRGAQVIEFSGGARARAWLESEEPADLVILDHHMPGLDGVDLVRRVRAMEHRRALPLVMLTPHMEHGLSVEARAAGVNRFVRRPIRRDELLRSLSELLPPVLAAEGWSEPVSGHVDPVAGHSLPCEGASPYTQLGSSGELASTEVPAGSAETTELSVTRPPGDTAALRVLVVEDNKVNQMVLLSMLRQLGIEPDVADDGKQALEAQLAEPYDLVFMDCQMPIMDGFEATARIRDSVGPGSTVPIVAVTANAMKGDRERCLQSGMSDYLAKPVRKHLLADMLERWVPREGRAETAA